MAELVYALALEASSRKGLRVRVSPPAHMKEKNFCLHCDPYPNDSSHASEKLELLLHPIIMVIIDPLEGLMQKFPRLNRALNKLIFYSFFKTLLAFRILREVEANDTDDKLYNRSLVVVREARKRGIAIKPLKFFGQSTNHFSIEVNGAKNFFEGLPCLEIEHISQVDFDDKGKFKELLQQAGLPCPNGRAFRDYLPALEFVRNNLKFPLVVKPRAGSLSKHTTCNIKTEDQLQKAVAIAKIISRDFVVEEFFEGDVHRVTLVNGNLAAACLREPPNVVGDGRSTIRELIGVKNLNPVRGEMHQRNFTLHKIIVTGRTDSLLAAQNLDLDSVPSVGAKIYLHDKVILACGADIHDTTDLVHPENKVLFKKVSELCRAPLIGIDFITPDISKPYREQPCAIIEVNSLPYIDMHHYPVTGQARNVAGHILDYYVSRH